MKYYKNLLRMGCFTREDLSKLVGNYDTAGSIIKSLLSKGYIRSVKRNLFVAINLADDLPVLNKFQIGCKLTDTSYISHHSAFQYYGWHNQMSNWVIVSSETRFNKIDFNGYHYVMAPSNIPKGVIVGSDGVRVTDCERTILDGISDFDKFLGLEELLRCISMVSHVDEMRILRYLEDYGKKFLYQKTGYILKHFQSNLRISDAFFRECAARIGKSSRYLSAEGCNRYNKEWGLVVPENLMALVLKGNFDDFRE